MPAPSPATNDQAGIWYRSAEITYSRPAAKGRQKFATGFLTVTALPDRLTPPPRIVLTEPVEFAGKRIDTGTYGAVYHSGIDSGYHFQQRPQKLGYRSYGMGP